MSDDPDVTEFIRTYIPSIWSLELLLLLQRDSERVWTPAALVKELRANTSLVDDNLSRLQRHGLVLETEAGWSFRPANFRLASLVAALAVLYRQRPMHVMGLIARSDAIRSLADAFRIKKDES